MPLASLPLKLFAEIINCCEADCHTICFDVPHLGIIEVAGPDATTFLQGQCTNNVHTLAANKAQISAICNTQGRVMSLFHLVKKNDCLYLILPTDLLQTTVNLLKKYAVFSKVSINDATGKYQLHGIFYKNDDNNPKDSQDHYYINHALSYVLTPANMSHHEPNNLLPAHEWDKLMLYYQHPNLRSDGVGKWLPSELGLLDLEAIDFEKGCYLGQEIIARMYYRSKRRFEIHIATVSISDTPLYGDVIDANNQTVGTIIDATPLSASEYIVLLSIKDGIYTEPLFLLKTERYDIELIAKQVESQK